MDLKNIIRIFLIISLFAAGYILKKASAKKQEALLDEADNNLEIDNAIDFGYKMQWFAVKTNDQKKIAEIIKLKKVSKSNWENGIKGAYQNSVFITPQIKDWIIVCGHGIPSGKEKQLLVHLSKEFGEVQFFATHRVSDYHSWMKAINGTIERSFTYSDEYDNGYAAQGNPTRIEKENGLTKEIENDPEYIDFIDEEFLMKIAENWSVDPTQLSQRKDIKPELGIVGTI